MEILKGWDWGREVVTGQQSYLKRFPKKPNHEIVYTNQDYMDSISDLKYTFDLLFRF